LSGRDRLVAVGRVSGLYGVRGWVRILSDTDPPERIFDYRPWYLDAASGPEVPVQPCEARVHGKGLLARIDGCDDRDAAAPLVGREISVPRAAFAEPGDDEVYWVDLLGLDVVTASGVVLGRIERLFATGANDVMVVQGDRERLVPFTPGDAVLEVDLDGRKVTVAWDPDF
jgi:16S rRNA processing protein RimM